MRIAIYGTGKKAEHFLNSIDLEKINIQIVYFVQTKVEEINVFRNIKIIEAKDINYSDFDKLIIATVYDDEIISYLQSINKYDETKIESYLNWLCPKGWAESAKFMPFRSSVVNEDVVFISSGTDQCIPNIMMETGKVFSEDIIKSFFELSNILGLKGGDYFLDIGANIGTTSIYVKKKVKPDLKIIGFEPEKRNYDLFRINCIVNGVEDIVIEQLGLSNENGQLSFSYNEKNSGASHIIKSEQNLGSKIQVAKLDDYLQNNNIDVRKIGYLWIDTEGHEAEVILGGLETLNVNKIPILQEFNPGSYRLNGVWNSYYESICQIYDSFIDVNKYIETKEIQIFSIEQLLKYAEQINFEQTDLLLF